MRMLAEAAVAAGLDQEWVGKIRCRDRHIAALEAQVDEQKAHIRWLEETVERLVLAADVTARTAAGIAADRKLFKRFDQHSTGTVIELNGRLDRLA